MICVSNLKQHFKSPSEALEFYVMLLEDLASTHGKTTEDYLEIAESQVMYNSELMEALSLAKTIKGLKSLKFDT